METESEKIRRIDRYVEFLFAWVRILVKKTGDPDLARKFESEWEDTL